MPYRTNSELPDGVKDNLPEHAPDIYRDAFNAGYDDYEDPDKRRAGPDREETAHAVAWAALRNKYEKGNDDRWHAMCEASASD
jgi:cation transport regulator